MQVLDALPCFCHDSLSLANGQIDVQVLDEIASATLQAQMRDTVIFNDHAVVGCQTWVRTLPQLLEHGGFMQQDVCYKGIARMPVIVVELRRFEVVVLGIERRRDGEPLWNQRKDVFGGDGFKMLDDIGFVHVLKLLRRLSSIGISARWSDPPRNGKSTVILARQQKRL